MQNGYQDVGSWTFFAEHDANRTAAAWLYAQFITSKTASGLRRRCRRAASAP